MDALRLSEDGDSATGHPPHSVTRFATQQSLLSYGNLDVQESSKDEYDFGEDSSGEEGDGELPLQEGHSTELFSEFLWEDSRVRHVYHQFKGEMQQYQPIHYAKVPCKVIVPSIDGLCGLSEAAISDQGGGADGQNQLRFGEVVELHLLIALHYLSRNEFSVGFPSCFQTIKALEKNPEVLRVGGLHHLYFELGLFLCKIIPEQSWIVQNADRLLNNARRQRFLMLMRQILLQDDVVVSRASPATEVFFEKRHAQDTLNFLHGLTWFEQRLLKSVDKQRCWIARLDLYGEVLKDW